MVVHFLLRDVSSAIRFFRSRDGVLSGLCYVWASSASVGTISFASLFLLGSPRPHKNVRRRAARDSAVL